jgi:hypothetical protein
MRIFHGSLVLAAWLTACNGKAPGEDTPRVAVATQDKLVEDFEKDNPKWKFAVGTWVRRAGVLAQTAETPSWGVAILEDKKFADVEVSVKFRPVSGKGDASGGVIFRARDANNYYVVRGNALEDNFRLYTMKDGTRAVLASVKVSAPKLGEWHGLRVVAKGAKIQAYLDGKLLIDHEDKTYSDGYVGLWTKADSVTEFDDLEASGSGG